MFQRIREARKNEDGFTLIELLLVIIILGVLAGIVVFAVNGINDRGTASACKSDKKNVEIASEAYYAQNKAYAAKMQDLLDAKLLREAPSSKDYTINYNADGTVTTTGTCS